MDRKPTQTKQPTEAETREARLKAALKANMAKRKAQARARLDGNSGNAADTQDKKE